MSGEGESRSGEKQILRTHKNDQLFDGLMAQLVEDCISIAQVKIQHLSKFHFRGPSLKSYYKACDMSLRDVQTTHFSNMLARDSVILPASATKMVKTYLFPNSIVHFRRIEPKNASYCQELRCFYKSHPGTVQIGSSRSALLNGRFRRRLF